MLPKTGLNEVQRLNLQKELNNRDLKPHKSHPCREEFRTVTSPVDGEPALILSTSPRLSHGPDPKSTEYRDFVSRLPATHNMYQGAGPGVQYAGKSSFGGDYGDLVG